MPDASAPTERSSHRVDDDVRHRPGCPAARRARLHRSQRIDTGHALAGIDSGTRVSTRMWFDAGHAVVAATGYAVEGQADFGYDTRVFVGTLG
jgi:hypothetical protein